MSLLAENLTIGRAGLPLLTKLTLQVGSGEVVCLRGPNGVGKTSLLRTLAGLSPPLQGRIEVAVGDVAYLGHENGIKLQLSVAENLRFWAEIFGAASKGPAAIEGALDQLDLSALSHRLAGDLSAGQKRRLALARLPLTGQRVWCLDEPNVGLDTANEARFIALLAAHLERGGSALIATHTNLNITAKDIDLKQFIPDLSELSAAPAEMAP